MSSDNLEIVIVAMLFIIPLIWFLNWQSMKDENDDLKYENRKLKAEIAEHYDRMYPLY